MPMIRPIAPSHRATAARPLVAARPAPAPARPAATPVVAKTTSQPWSFKQIAAAAGIGGGAFVGGGAATFVADLFLHFGNNGGTAWPGGIYLTVAGLAAAGAIALYTHAKGDK